MFLLFSYFNTSDEVKVQGRQSGGIDELYSRAYGTGTDYTAISAYQDTLFCFSDYRGASLWCRYVISYNAGTGTLTVAPSIKGDFKAFLSTETGYGTVEVKGST